MNSLWCEPRCDKTMHKLWQMIGRRNEKPCHCDSITLDEFQKGKGSWTLELWKYLQIAWGLNLCCDWNPDKISLLSWKNCQKKLAQVYFYSTQIKASAYGQKNYLQATIIFYFWTAFCRYFKSLKKSHEVWSSKLKKHRNPRVSYESVCLPADSV